MHKLFLLLITMILVSCECSQKNQPILTDSGATTTYYLIRHAEKDRTDPLDRDPKLTEQGVERAKRWAEFFQKVKLDLIYSTDYQRTQQTVKYIAEGKKLNIKSYDPMVLLTEDILKETKGKNVLIVGHSNTTPKFVNMLLGKEEYGDMDDSDNSSLFIVTMTGNSKKVQILNVN